VRWLFERKDELRGVEIIGGDWGEGEGMPLIIAWDGRGVLRGGEARRKGSS